MKYAIVTSESTTAFELEVSRYLGMGWELKGELKVINVQKYEKPPCSDQYMQITKPLFIQELVKKDKE